MCAANWLSYSWYPASLFTFHFTSQDSSHQTGYFNAFRSSTLPHNLPYNLCSLSFQLPASYLTPDRSKLSAQVSNPQQSLHHQRHKSDFASGRVRHERSITARCSCRRVPQSNSEWSTYESASTTASQSECESTRASTPTRSTQAIRNFKAWQLWSS